MRRFRDLMMAHKRFSFGLWIVVLAAVVAGAQWQLAGRSSKLQAQVLGAQAKKPPAVPTITSGPSDPTNSTSATFVFNTNPAPAGYLCKLDAGSFSTCASPKVYAGPLSAGSHTFQVEAQDAGFTTNPASRTWTVDVTPPPPPTITQKPDNPSFDTKPHFAYSDSEAGVTFQCQMDSAAAAACGSSVDYSKLGFGDHTFTVWAFDVAGNRSPAATSATYSWTFPENKAFGITDAVVGSTFPRQPLYPGGSSPLDLKLSNPYNFTIRVTGITVTATAAVKATHQDPRCSVATDLSTSGLITRNPATTPTVDLPANSSRTLSSYLASSDLWPADWPRITMANTAGNQDDCKNTTFTLSYTGTANKS